jgi:hypothetical protein
MYFWYGESSVLKSSSDATLGRSGGLWAHRHHNKRALIQHSMQTRTRSHIQSSQSFERLRRHDVLWRVEAAEQQHLRQRHARLDKIGVLGGGGEGTVSACVRVKTLTCL